MFICWALLCMFRKLKPLIVITMYRRIVYTEFNILLTVHHAMILGKRPT